MQETTAEIQVKPCPVQTEPDREGHEEVPQCHRELLGLGYHKKEGIHVILGSIWPSAEIDSTPQEFVLLCFHPNCHVFNLLLASTSKREADPLMLNFSFQSKYRSTFPLRAAGSCLVEGDADGSASPAATANMEESGEG